MADKKFPNPNELDLSQRKEFDVKINVKEILPAVVRTALDSFLGKPSVGTIAQLLKTTGFVSNKEQQAFELLLESLMKAIADQLKDYFQKIEESEEDYFYEDEMLRFDVFEKLESLNFDINYLSHPRGILFLEAFGKLYQTWLIDNLQMLSEEAVFHTNNFSDYFAYAFYRELVIQPKRYADLKEYYDNPDRKRLTLVVNRNYYKQELRAYFHKHTLGEDKIILKQVYIKPSFQVYKAVFSTNQGAYLSARYKVGKEQLFYPTDYSGNIHDYFLEYFIHKKKCYAINSYAEKRRLLLLLGQPGHGKSSFCYKAMDDLIGRGFNGGIFFCRLKDADEGILGTKKETLKHILSDLRLEEIEAKNWLKENEKADLPTVLFLDGLDELCMAHNLSEDKIIAFMNNCKALLRKYKHLFIVITSRFNYLEIDRCYNADCLILELGVLTKEDQINLLDKHQKCNPRKKWHFEKATIEKIHENRNLNHIKELIALPILMQLVLLSGVDIEQHQSRTAIYGHLFDKIIDRKWSNDQRFRKYNYQLEAKDLRTYISWLAYKIYQNKKGYITRQKIEEDTKTKAFIQKAIKDKIEKGKHLRNALKDVLILFYLNETQTNNKKGRSNYAIEFMHKSLCEYLMCEYLWIEVKRLFLEEYNRQNFSKEVLKEIQNLFSHIKLSTETISYLKEIMAREEEQQYHDDLMNNMSNYLPDLLKYGWLYQYKMSEKEEKIFYTAKEQTLNICYAYVLIWSELGKHTINRDNFFESDWESFWEKYMQNADVSAILKTYASKFEQCAPNHIRLFATLKYPPFIEEIEVKKIQMWLRSYAYTTNGKKKFHSKIKGVEKQKEEFVKWLRFISNARLNTTLFLPFLSLYNFDLRGWIGKNTCFNGGDFRKAYLQGTNFNYNDSFSGNPFSEVYVNDSKLMDTDLSDVDLSDADLRDAKLVHIGLRNAKLCRTSFLNSDLSTSILDYADLRFANLEGANLQSVKFRYANLFNAYLNRSNLNRADFSWANLNNARLEGANLSSANFSNACLINANLREVYLEGADFSYANLEGARVSALNWIERVTPLLRGGSEWVYKNFEVSKKSKKYQTKFGVYSAYEILRKSPPST